MGGSCCGGNANSDWADENEASVRSGMDRRGGAVVVK